MLENLRRKSSYKTYNGSIHQIHFEQGHVIYLDSCSIAEHRQRLSKENQEKSFPSTFDGVSKDFKLIPSILGKVKFNMIYCPRGTFIMGHEDQKDNQPRPETIEKAFLLGETEVTQDLYKAVMGQKHNPSKFKNDSQNPVEQVCWATALEFCNKLSELQGLDKCYGTKPYRDCDFSKNGYRLPTEKEWEYAAKAGTNNRWAGTDNQQNLRDYAIYKENSKINNRKQTHPVATKLPNEWGFYDMSGNVWEWCWDWCLNSKDPNVLDPFTYRVCRGSSWKSGEAEVKYADRGALSPTLSYDSVGFRVCRTLV